MTPVEQLAERWRLVYQTLASGTRRQLVGSLIEADPGESLPLPEAANSPEYRLDPAVLTTNLLHEHLPMMTDAAFIEWDEEPFRVSRGSRFEELSRVLLAVDEYDKIPSQLVDGCYFHGDTVNP